MYSFDDDAKPLILFPLSIQNEPGYLWSPDEDDQV